MIGVLEAMVDRLLAVEALQFWSLVVVWVVLSLASMGIATAKGRSGGLYLLLGLFLSPVVSMIAAVAQPDSRGEVIADLRARLAVIEAASAPASAHVETPAPPASEGKPTPRESIVTVLAWLLVAAMVVGGLFLWLGQPRPR